MARTFENRKSSVVKSKTTDMFTGPVDRQEMEMKKDRNTCQLKSLTGSLNLNLKSRLLHFSFCWTLNRQRQ